MEMVRINLVPASMHTHVAVVHDPDESQKISTVSLCYAWISTATYTVHKRLFVGIWTNAIVATPNLAITCLASSSLTQMAGDGDIH